MNWLVVALGAALGAPVRYLTDQAISRRQHSVFPWGTFTVNVLGSFALGVVAGSVANAEIALLLAVGFCGALTTYSTFAYESVNLAKAGSIAAAGANVVGTIVATLAACWVGLELAGAFAS